MLDLWDRFVNNEISVMKLLDSVCQIYDDTISYNLSRMNVYDARSSSEDDTDTDESD